MSLIRSLTRSLVPSRSGAMRMDITTLDDWLGVLSGDTLFPFTYNRLGEKEEEIGAAFNSLLSTLRTNGPVFACEAVRVMLFSEARFLFRQRRSGKPGDYFSNASLRILERPQGPGSTTAGMMKRAMLHADYGGTAFLVNKRGRIVQPRPDWMTIMLGSEDDPTFDGSVPLDAEVIGYQYHPAGLYGGARPVTLLPEQVATFVPMPDPVAHVRGIPWLSAVSRNIMSHNAARNHKLRFFENGATPQMIVSLDLKLDDPAKLRQWIEVIEQDHKGTTNAYKTLYLAAGAKADVVGKDLQQLDFKATQGADETLIAAAAGVGPVVAQLSEGLQGSSLNAGNFAQAMRRVADITMRPLWRDMAGSLEVFAPPSSDAELWYDDSDIPALKDDIKDRAEVLSLNATAIRTLGDGGWVPDTVTDAIVSGDLKRLKHSGQLSVQLQEPGQAPAQPRVAAGGVPMLEAGPVDVRCPSCDKLVARRLEAGGSFEVKCDRCKTLVAA